MSERPGSSADRAEGGRAREGHLQITYSEAMLFTLLSLVLIIAAYVLGRSSAKGAAPGDAGAEEPIQTLSAGQLLPDRGGRSAEVSPRIAAVGKKSSVIWTLRAAEFMGRDKGAAGSLARDLQKRYKHRAWVVPSRRTKGRWEVFCGRFAKSSDPDLAKLEKALTTYRSKSGPGILAKSLERVSIVQ